MKPPWSLVREILEAALEVDATSRREFIQVACRGNAALLAEVQELIDADSDVSDNIKLETGAADDWLESTRLPSPGDKVGEFVIRKLIACGGMGAVFEANQTAPERVVALKMLRGGQLSESAIRRFDFEADILARLQHPGIAQIHFAGIQQPEPDTNTHSFPYLAVELVEGALPITSYVRTHARSRHQRLLLFLDVCDAVHHAHLRGIIHRDLKPANILVGTNGRPKVIDFGIARFEESGVHNRLTEAGQLLGTLGSMSPEQLAGRVDEIDLRSDVYSLGVILYELLCDQPPFDTAGQSLSAAIDRLRKQQLDPPAQIDPTLRGELDWIVRKSMDPDQNRRYESADHLAADIRRALSHQPVEAGPPTRSYIVRKFVRRHRMAVATSALITLTILIGSIATGLAWIEAKTQRDSAQRATKVAIRESQNARTAIHFLSETLERTSPEHDGRHVTLVEVLDRSSPTISVRFADQPEVALTLHRSLSRTYRALGRPDSSIRHDQAVVALLQSMRPSDDPDLAHARSQLGISLYLNGRFEQGEKLVSDSLATLIATVGDRDDRTITAIVQHAVAVLVRGDAEESYRLFQRAVELCKTGNESGVSPRDFELRMAAAAFETQRLQEAEEIYLRRVDDDNPIDASSARLGYCLVLQQEQDFERAEKFLEGALEISREQLGESAPMKYSVLSYLANNDSMAGHYERAIERHQECVDYWERREGPGGMRMTTDSINLASTLIQIGRYSEAESILDAILDYDRPWLKERTKTRASAWRFRARILKERGLSNEAIAAFENALALFPRAIGLHDRTIEASVLAELSSAHFNAGNLTEAENTARRADSAFRRLGSDHRLSTFAQPRLARIVQLRGSPSEAARIMRECIETRERLELDDAGEARGIFAMALIGLRDWEQAEREAFAAIEASRKSVPPGETRLFTLTHAKALGGLGRYEEALSELRPLVENDDAINEFPPMVLPNAVAVFDHLLLKTNRDDERIQFRERFKAILGD